MTPSVWAIVVAAGSGTRFGSDQPKQYAALGDRRCLDYALAAAQHACPGAVVLVVAPDRAHDAEPLADVVVAGGASRSASVRAGLAAIPADAEVVVVHDAARPLAPARMWAAVVEAVRSGSDGAVPGVGVTDTIKQIDATGHVVATPDRTSLVAVQTPQAFRAEALRAAHAPGADGTDDAALVEADGGRVVVVPGDVRARKVTTADDLEVLSAHISSARRGRSAMTTALRIGHGYDVHAFVADDPDRPLVLAGVTLPGATGLRGHSDADAVAHAVTDALLGAAGLGDIGMHFPDTDPTWKGADSMQMLAEVVSLLAGQGWSVVNVDVTVVLEAPKLAPYKAEMVERLSAVLLAPASVKAKRAEGLGALGRREGIACYAVTLIEQAAAIAADVPTDTRGFDDGRP